MIDTLYVGQTIYFLNPCEKRNILLLLFAIFIKVWVLTPVQPVTLNIWPTQQLQSRTNFYIIIFIYAYKNIQKVLLLDLVKGYIGYMSYLPSTNTVHTQPSIPLHAPKHLHLHTLYTKTSFHSHSEIQSHAHIQFHPSKECLKSTATLLHIKIPQLIFL